MARKLDTEFTFAGFNFPRYIPQLTKSRYDKRTSRSVYFHSPRPEEAGKGMSFYLDSDGSFDRWIWCDDVDGVRINHTGWYCDEFGDSDKIRGIVVRLSHGRFLAGWSMGEGMASYVEGEIYTDIKEAAYAADSMAETAAEEQREYEESENARIAEEERRESECLGDDAEETEGY